MRFQHKWFFLFLFPALGIQAQSTVDQLLASISTRNKSILTEQQRLEASQALFRTGLTLPDPELTLDWMQGVPSSAGIQTDFTAAQAFDFPTVYRYRREISGLKASQTALESAAVRQEILLEAKQIALHLVYLNKKKTELTGRLKDAEAFLENYQNKLLLQEATALELNKAKILLVHVKTDLQLLEAERAENLERLIDLNGGEPVVFQDTVYPPAPDLPAADSLLGFVLANDPGLARLKMQRRISETDVRLTRADLLPKFETGYRYQGLLGQQFHGVHFGLSIPLWENNKRLRYAELKVVEEDNRLDYLHTERYHETKRLYDQYLALGQNLQDFREGLPLDAGMELLKRALEAGELTVLEYFLETMLYYESVDRYLELEEAWHQVGAELLKTLL